eukprot:NODE_107_length_19843_cov_0.502077.p5 type:complete len:432 gc:universal NODE_107_length_19843_cov_0.502077:8825-7530(-)
MHDSSKAGIFGVTINMINSVLGAGVIGTAFAFRLVDYPLGIFLTCLLAFLSSWTMKLLVRCGEMTNRFRYPLLLEYVLGYRGFILSTVLQFAMAYGGLCAFYVIIGDNLPKLLRKCGLDIERTIVLVLVYPIILGISLIKNLSALARASALSVGTLLFIIGVIIYRLFHGPYAKEPTEISDPEAGFFGAIGILLFAFVCHHNTFLMRASLTDPTYERFSKVINICFITALSCCMTSGIIGYYIFGVRTKSDLLENFAENTMSICTKLAFCFIMMMTYPLELFVAREVADNFFFLNLVKVPNVNEEIGQIQSSAPMEAIELFKIDDEESSIISNSARTNSMQSFGLSRKHSVAQSQHSVKVHQPHFSEQEAGVLPLSNEDEFQPPPMPVKRHILWTVGLTLSTLVVAYFTEDVAIVLDLTGGIAACTLGTYH